MSNDQMVASRQRLAQEYDGEDPAVKRTLLVQFRVRQRAQRMAARIARDARAASGVERPLPTSHWGMGTTLWPLATPHLQKALGCQGGIRASAANCLPETELVIPPAARRLTLPQGARDFCECKHPGFCKTRDADISVRVACIHKVLVKWATPPSAGKLLLRFYPTDGSDTRNRAFDVHVSFASLRQEPKYCAMFAHGKAKLCFFFYKNIRESDEAIRSSAHIVFKR